MIPRKCSAHSQKIDRPRGRQIVDLRIQHRGQYGKSHQAFMSFEPESHIVRLCILQGAEAGEQRSGAEVERGGLPSYDTLLVYWSNH